MELEGQGNARAPSLWSTGQTQQQRAPEGEHTPFKGVYTLLVYHRMTENESQIKLI